MQVTSLGWSDWVEDGRGDLWWVLLKTVRLHILLLLLWFWLWCAGTETWVVDDGLDKRINMTMKIWLSSPKTRPKHKLTVWVHKYPLLMLFLCYQCTKPDCMNTHTHTHTHTHAHNYSTKKKNPALQWIFRSTFYFFFYVLLVYFTSTALILNCVMMVFHHYHNQYFSINTFLACWIAYM